jgi:hypothetical protein
MTSFQSFLCHAAPFTLAAILAAQAPNATPAKPGANDPFTGGDEKAMRAAGVVAYGPFPWADKLRTEDVDKVLGEQRIQWLETEHFLLGCTLGACSAPEDPDARQLLNAELARMRKRHGKFPDRASKLEPWLRLHLYAQRAEALYADFATLVGYEAGDGKHMGQRDKIPIVLFQKKSDVARYLDRFCGHKSELSQRCWYSATGAHGFVLGAEGDEVRDEATVHAHFRFLLVQTFCDTVGGLPYWLSLGLAHRYERQVPTRAILAVPKDGENVDQGSQHQWLEKMKKRAQHEKLLLPFHELATQTDFGYWAHLQAWSRVEYLLTLDRAKFRAFVAGMRGGFGSARQAEQLDTLYGFTPDVFDAKWREWVLKAAK